MSEFSHAIQEFPNYGMPPALLSSLLVNLRKICKTLALALRPPLFLRLPPLQKYFLQTFSLNCSAALKLIELHTKFPWKICPNNLLVSASADGFNKHQTVPSQAKSEKEGEVGGQKFLHVDTILA